MAAQSNPFSDSEIAREIRGLARQFARKEILPVIAEDEENERFRPELIARLGEVGLTGIPTPEALGGSGLGYVEYIGAIEEIAQASAAYAISVSVSGLPQLILNRFGTDDQKKKYVPRLAQGKAIGAFSLSEPASGSDAAALRTVATRAGDRYVLKGTKLWTTQADVAETLIVMARTGEPGPKGISSFIVEKGMKGFKLGKREKKMGLHASHTMEVVFEGIEIPEANRVGAEGEGFKIAMSALDTGRITMGATSVGIAQAALDVASRYSREREQFGRPIGEFQAISFILADMATEIEAARLLVEKAAWLRDQGKPFTKEAAMAKLLASDTAMRVTTNAVQVLGGAGYTRDFPVERYMREAKVMQIVEGTNQVQRMVIGRAILSEAAGEST